MSKIIKTSIGLALVFFTFSVKAGCQFAKDQPVYLFSGPMATMVYRLNLYQDENIKGILNSYNFNKSALSKSISIFEGGIYASQKILSTLPQNAIIFLDDVKELEKNLVALKLRLKTNWQIQKIITSNKSPDTLSNEVLESLKKFLIQDKDCEKRIETITLQIRQYSEKIKTFSIMNESSSKDTPIYFLMGKANNGVIPADALVLYKEGFITDLITNRKILPYHDVPEDVSYGPWSAKLLFKKKAYKILINSELEDKNQIGWMKIIGKDLFQVECFACLIPGITQLDWFLHLKSVTP